MNYQNHYLYGYQNQYSQPQQQYYNQQQMQQPVQQQVVYPLTYTNGIIGAKAFFMAQPNSMVYLLDSDTNNILYEKRADANGRCFLKAYQLKEIPLEQVGANVDEKIEYATKGDIERLEQTMNNSLSNILITLKGAKNDEQ